MRELTEGEMEIVEQRLADLFVHECHRIAAELGFTGPSYSDRKPRRSTLSSTAGIGRASSTSPFKTTHELV